MAPNIEDTRQIRVFLSSTFRDFMQERDLLVKQVFPALRRRAQERGVEVVDVDLRWGITEEESQQGKVIGICLAEIERCRPYFIGMLGERYGWTPQPGDYPDELFEREPLQWIRDHQGNASVTELEILHGVLNDKEMAGRAFFYFRDPAWSRAQSEPGFVCDTEEEQQKLAALKERIRASGFPVADNLADPQAIADQIEADLWALIEELYPELDQADALEREERKHAGYRQSRLGVYLGGEGYIQQLEQMIQAGEPRILITGDSGAGKSALLANWLAAHGQAHPDDVVHAHHLGCSNDANAIRPLLARMLDTASRLLLEHELIFEPIQVPQDWWELTAKVAGTLQDLSRWCRNTGHRWIWVLDGLDRLDADDQQALPWLPLLIPEGVSVVISALECNARSILEDRQFRALTIGPLQRPEQEALIERYLERYTKKLEPERRQQILNCELGTSPLFLKVLLEELRQCGRFETLKDQIEGYIKPKEDGSLAVSDLYERVLERLENDCGVEVVRKVMTALWASRAGLSESELLGITGLAPLQWAPIDLALEQALRRKGNQLVFDHEYLRTAVQEKYLPKERERRFSHSAIADYFDSRDEWEERDSEELPWQLVKADRLSDLREWLSDPVTLESLASDIDDRDIIDYWLKCNDSSGMELDEAIAEAVEEEIVNRKGDPVDLIHFVDCISDLLQEAGLYRELLLRLRTLSLELEEATEDREEEWMLSSLARLANAHHDMGQYDQAKALYLRCLEARERLLGPDHPDTLTTVGNLASLYQAMGNYERAASYYVRCQEARERSQGPEHPDTLDVINNRAVLCRERGRHLEAETLYIRCLEAQERLLGRDHPDTLNTVANLGVLYRKNGNFRQAEHFYKRALGAREKQFGDGHLATLVVVNNLGSLYWAIGDPEQAIAFHVRALESSELLIGLGHPFTLTCLNNLGTDYKYISDFEQAESCFKSCLERREELLGSEHPSTLTSIGNLAGLLQDKGDYDKAEEYYNRCLEAQEWRLGPEHPNTLTTVGNLGSLYQDKGDYEQAEAYYSRCMEARERILGANHPDTNGTRFSLANLLSDQERYDESIPLRRQELEVAAKRDGRDASGTLTSIHRLAQDLYWADELEESEQLYREALAGRIAALGDDDGATMASRYGLARCLSAQDRYDEAIELRRLELAWCQANDDMDTKDMLVSMHGLGCDLLAAGETDEALEVLQSCLNQRQQELGASDDDTLATLARVLEALSSLDRQREGLALSRATQEALVAELGENDPKVFTQLSNQADLHDELGELEQAEALYRRCLAGREDALGADHPSTLSTAYSLADVLSQLERRSEAIPLRRRELAWCRQQNGDTDPGTLTSINALAIDLRETRALEEAEALFRELLAARQKVLEPGDFGIGRALGGLAKTLEEAGKLEEAVALSQQALDHRLAHEGPDAWVTNRERLDHARVLHKLERFDQAIALLNELQTSMAGIEDPDQDDQELLAEAAELRATIQPDGKGENL